MENKINELKPKDPPQEQESSEKNEGWSPLNVVEDAVEIVSDVVSSGFEILGDALSLIGE